MYELEHPDISRCLLGGYPRSCKEEICPLCREALGDYAYEISPGELICEDCFKEQMEDMIRLNPILTAEAMDIPWIYRL